MTGKKTPKLWHGDEPGPLAQRLTSIQIARLYDFFTRSGTTAFQRASGLSSFEWMILGRVCEAPPFSINDLSGLLHRSVGQVSRTVSRLVGAGLLKRENKGGGPGVLITPTQVGRAVYKPLEELAAKRDAELLQGLSEQEIKVLRRCIEVMTENALALLAQEQERVKHDPRT